MRKIITLLFIISLGLSAFSSSEKENNILILNSYHPGFIFSDDEVKGVKKAIGGKANVKVFYMDTKLNPLDEREREIYSTLKEKYKENPDVIVSLDNNALTFLKKYRDELFPNVPIVFSGVNDYTPDLIKGMNGVTGVGEGHTHKEIVDLIRKLHPDVEWIIHVTDNTHSSQLDMKQFIDFANNYDEMKNIIVGSMSSWTLLEFKKFIDEVQEYSNAVLYVTGFYRDRLGYKIRHSLALKVLNTLGNIPVYTHAPQFLDASTGGAILVGETYGEMAGEKALKILQGATTENIPISVETPVKYYFNFEEIKKFKISRKNLPKGSIIFNKPETFYTKHSGLSILIILIIVIDGILIYALIKNRNKLKRYA